MNDIQMVDLKGQYSKIKNEIDYALHEVIDSAAFINGPAVSEFRNDLQSYLNVKHVIPCANGTDALQIALMALGLEPGDEVIVPAFTYVATAEVIGLLKLTPVMVDVDSDTFNVTAPLIQNAVSPRTKAIVPVHLFGQSCDMEPILDLADKYNLLIVEDNAQAIGADYRFSNGATKKTGTIGHIGTTSFFPSKNLGCYGDGGAMFTNDDDLGAKMKMIANHGQAKKYYHSVIGVNSRLDTVQAAILKIKLRHLDDYCLSRQRVAEKYDEAFAKIAELQTPVRENSSSHVFHQYTLRVKDGLRDRLKAHLSDRNIPSMVYYPVPLYKQDAFKHYSADGFELPVTEQLCSEVISLPVHTEMTSETQEYIIDGVKSFFRA